MTRILGLLSAVLLLFNAAYAQVKTDEVLFTVGDEKVSVAEFKYIYEKNNSINEDEELYTRQSLEDYLDLYVKFKLKVHEARAQGMDTTEAFKKEFKGYRNQLAQPYLKDKTVSEQLIEEAYERMKYEIKASHILIDVKEDAFPSDTLKAYNLAMDAKKRVENGEDFAEVAKDFAKYTRDQTLETRGGDLGYFTVFNMIYPFESAAYNTPLGGIAGPVRTRFGYHVIKITDKKPYQGDITAAHIMIRTDLGTGEDQEEMAKDKIDSIYQRLEKGESFDKLARTESQHYSSATNGGKLRAFNSMATWLPREIIENAFALKEDGNFSEPFLTKYGWHIVKRVKLDPLKPYDEMKQMLKRKVERDSRSQLSQKSAINRIKKENGFKSWPKRLKDFKEPRDSSILRGKWTMNPDERYRRKLFKIGKIKYRQEDFANYLLEKQKPGKFTNPEYAIDYYFQQFVNESVLEYEDERLEEKYEEFRNIVKEYEEGILLFEITDEQVWSKAMKDSTGQRAYYQNHIDEFQWKERADVIIFYCKDKETAEQIKSKLAEDNANVNAVFKELNKDNSMTFSFSKDVFERGEEEVLSKVKWEKGFAEVPDYNDRYVLIKFNEILEPQAKKFKEVKGLVIADYQDQLEKEWIEQLKKKYPVDINQSVVEKLIK